MNPQKARALSCGDAPAGGGRYRTRRTSISSERLAALAILVACLSVLPSAQWIGTIMFPNSGAEAAQPASLEGEPPTAQKPGGSFAVRDVRVFDGDGVLPRATVVVINGVITDVGANATIPGGIAVLNGAGHTMLPGLIDAHTHTRNADELESALAFGVTTQLDMRTLPEFAAARRREQAEGRANGRADLFSAGTAVTTPGGHGSTGFGSPPPMLSKPEEADTFVRARLDEGSDYIKIIVDDGRMWARTQPTLDRATVAALIAAVHKHGKRAIAHTVTLDDVRAAAAAGIDGLVHVWVDREPDVALLAEMRRRRMFVTPTLAVWKTRIDGFPGVELLKDARFEPLATSAQVMQLEETRPLNPERTTPARYERAAKSVAALSKAGVRILAGSDAPNPGTTFGISLHHELQLLVEAGLTPQQALAAATAAAADAFGLGDRGRIEPGRRADLLLVDGDPLADITRTRSIVSVWKAGHPFAREVYAVTVAERRKTLESGVAGLGLVSDFETGKPSTSVGGNWLASTDALAGGKSSAVLEVVPGGADGSAHALRITSDVAGGVSEPWAGAILFPAGSPAPVNLSAASGFRFAARGAAATYRVGVGTRRSGRASAVRTFTAGPDWQTFAFRWADFDNVDGTDVVRIAIVAGPQPGRYVLQIDNFEIR
jgi:imidazolonepropionase-like amidohydrolase